MRGLSGGSFTVWQSSTSRQEVFHSKITKDEAKEKGLRFYFSNKRCSCGNYIRYTSGGACDICCNKVARDKRKAANPIKAHPVNTETRRSIEDIKESLEPDYWDSLLD